MKQEVLLVLGKAIGLMLFQGSVSNQLHAYLVWFLNFLVAELFWLGYGLLVGLHSLLNFKTNIVTTKIGDVTVQRVKLYNIDIDY